MTLPTKTYTGSIKAFRFDADHCTGKIKFADDEVVALGGKTALKSLISALYGNGKLEEVMGAINPVDVVRVSKKKPRTYVLEKTNGHYTLRKVLRKGTQIPMAEDCLDWIEEAIPGFEPFETLASDGTMCGSISGWHHILPEEHGIKVGFQFDFGRIRGTSGISMWPIFTHESFDYAAPIKPSKWAADRFELWSCPRIRRTGPVQEKFVEVAEALDVYICWRFVGASENAKTDKLDDKKEDLRATLNHYAWLNMIRSREEAWISKRLDKVESPYDFILLLGQAANRAKPQNVNPLMRAAGELYQIIAHRHWRDFSLATLEAPGNRRRDK